MTFDRYTLENLLFWFLPWIILGMSLGIYSLFVVPYAPLYAFPLGLAFITMDRCREVKHRNYE